VISNGGFGHEQCFRDSLAVDTGRTESHDLAFTCNQAGDLRAFRIRARLGERGVG
jgi:hypothetical protein